MYLKPSENGIALHVVLMTVPNSLLPSSPMQAGGLECPESQQSGPIGAVGVEGRPEELGSRLNDFLKPLSLSCLVSLRGVYSGAYGEGVGQEEGV